MKSPGKYQPAIDKIRTLANYKDVHFNTIELLILKSEIYICLESLKFANPSAFCFDIYLHLLRDRKD